MTELNVTVIEQPGTLGRQKAQMLSRMLQQFYLTAPPELRAEIDRRAAELKKQREELADNG